MYFFFFFFPLFWGWLARIGWTYKKFQNLRKKKRTKENTDQTIHNIIISWRKTLTHKLGHTLCIRLCYYNNHTSQRARSCVILSAVRGSAKLTSTAYFLCLAHPCGCIINKQGHTQCTNLKPHSFQDSVDKKRETPLKIMDNKHTQ